jgi:hypothetical protein
MDAGKNPRSASTLLPMIVDLASRGREGILDRGFRVLVARPFRRGVTDHDVFIRRACQQDVDLKTCSVPRVIARSDYGHLA